MNKRIFYTMLITLLAFLMVISVNAEGDVLNNKIVIVEEQYQLTPAIDVSQYKLSANIDEPKYKKYSSDYGYKYLAERENGQSMQALYNEIDKVATLFHTDTSIIASSNCVASFNFTDLGLSEEAAIEVWITYKNDHPLYYWISTSFGISDTSIYLLTDSDYADGDKRAIYNDIIYNAVEEYSLLVENETST